ncbi:hypothetical protein ACLB2K_060318 [Fragaria x ananassa]
MTALATLTPPQLSDLTHTLLSLSHHHRRRISSLLSSPILFTLTIRRLNSLSLHHKTLLIASHVISSLHPLILHFQPAANAPKPRVKLRDLDAVLLLLLLCEAHQRDPGTLQAPVTKWREVVGKLYCDSMLTVSGIGDHNASVLVSYVEMLTRCLRFVSCSFGGKAGREVAASKAVVVALPSVEVKSGGTKECVICKEEMAENRDVCELPCRHLFHWVCILQWLSKRNTCPCCRFGLPTDDVYGEIQRLWEVLVSVSSDKGFSLGYSVLTRKPEEKKNSGSAMEEANLPEEMIVLILTLLPAKSLIRLTCVSKRFHSIILSDPKFAKSQFQAARDRKTLDHTLIYSVKGPRFGSLDLGTPSFGDPSSARNLNLPFGSPAPAVALLGYSSLLMKIYSICGTLQLVSSRNYLTLFFPQLKMGSSFMALAICQPPMTTEFS